MMKRHARVMMSIQQQKKRNSILLLLCVSFFNAMDDNPSKRVTFTQETQAVRGARLVRDMREKIDMAQGSQRKWLQGLLNLYGQTHGSNQILIPRPVIPARSGSPLRISDILVQEHPKMQLARSAHSAFKRYDALVKNSSAALK